MARTKEVKVGYDLEVPMHSMYKQPPYTDDAIFRRSVSVLHETALDLLSKAKVDEQNAPKFLHPTPGNRPKFTEDHAARIHLIFQGLEKGKLLNFRAAFERFKNGSFHVCMQCEQEMSDTPRRRQVPLSLLCASCQEMYENHNLPAVEKVLGAPLTNKAGALKTARGALILENHPAYSGDRMDRGR